MPVVAIIGGQWGDEGKGKIVDMLAEKAEMVVRFSGGSNAGHTVINDYGEFTLLLVPLDGLEEDARGSAAIGTTRRGIGPVFSDKIARQGIRCGDLLDKEALL